MEYVKEKDLIVLDPVGGGTVAVKSPCEDMSSGHWYCATHLFHYTKENEKFDFNSHFSSGSHLVAWVCDKHGVEVP